MATVLTAGSNKTGRPTPLLHNLYSHKTVRIKMMFHRSGLRGRQQAPRADLAVPCAVSKEAVKCLRIRMLIYGGSDKYLQGLALELTQVFPGHPELWLEVSRSWPRL